MTAKVKNAIGSKKNIGSIIIQRAFSYFIEWKCKSGKVNSHLNRGKTVISIFKANSIQSSIWLYGFLCVWYHFCWVGAWFEPSNELISFSSCHTCLAQAHLLPGDLFNCFVEPQSHVDAYMHVWTLLKAAIHSGKAATYILYGAALGGKEKINNHPISPFSKPLEIKLWL